jgi:nickel/cobalt transporter (NiCoT) family protein
VLMLGAYEWAFVRPIRKVYYNLTITLVSVLVAVLIGGIEAGGLLGDELALKGWVWRMLDALNDNFNTLGFVVIGVFVLSWVVSIGVYRWRGYDRLGAA